MIDLAFAKGTAKGTATVSIPILLTMPPEVIWIAVIVFGLVCGSLMRTAKMVKDLRTGGDIRTDLLASLLAGGGNGIVAAMIIFLLNLNFLHGMAVAFTCAFVGFQPMDKLAALLLPGTGIDRLFKAFKWLMKNSDEK